jgi:VIT1/CCC1 family predicted Fe2+/Mn2+ transporter
MNPMLKAAASSALLFAGAVFGCGVLIVLGIAAFGHTGLGMVVTVPAELALWAVGFAGVWRGARSSGPVSRWVITGVWGVSFVLLAGPLFIATALAFDH